MYIYRCSFVSFSFNTNDKIKKIRRTCKKNPGYVGLKWSLKMKWKGYTVFVLKMCLNVMYTLCVWMLCILYKITFINATWINFQKSNSDWSLLFPSMYLTQVIFYVNIMDIIRTHMNKVRRFYENPQIYK